MGTIYSERGLLPSPAIFLRSVVVNALGALAATAIEWTMSSGPDSMWLIFCIALAYAESIGLLLSILVPAIWRAFPRQSLPFRISFRLMATMTLCVIGSVIAGLVLKLFPLPFYYDFWGFFRQNVKLSILIGCAMAFTVATFATMQSRLQAAQLELKTRELERERALKQATEARLASLESRIHPHFLFNTINSVSSLIHDDPDRAERLLERMAALLRFSLDSEQNGLVALEREMKIVADYLEIEKTRFGDRLRFSIDPGPRLSQFCVPPLSIQTLVENSVKFAIAPRREGGQILVQAACENGKLAVEVWDDGPPFSLDSIPTGHGLDNLQSRLSTVFPTGAYLAVEPEEVGKTVRMTIPVMESEMKTA